MQICDVIPCWRLECNLKLTRDKMTKALQSTSLSDPDVTIQEQQEGYYDTTVSK